MKYSVDDKPLGADGRGVASYTQSVELPGSVVFSLMNAGVTQPAYGLMNMGTMFFLVLLRIISCGEWSPLTRLRVSTVYRVVF